MALRDGRATSVNSTADVLECTRGLAATLGFSGSPGVERPLHTHVHKQNWGCAVVSSGVTGCNDLVLRTVSPT